MDWCGSFSAGSVAQRVSIDAAQERQFLAFSWGVSSMRSGRGKSVAHEVMNEPRAPCTGSGPGPRSALRADCVVLLGAGAHGQLALRPSGTLRSDRGRESEVEARDCAPPRRLRCAPRPSMGPEPVQGTRISANVVALQDGKRPDRAVATQSRRWSRCWLRAMLYVAAALRQGRHKTRWRAAQGRGRRATARLHL